MELNENQRKAVETIDGQVLVIASPGSGKTRVVIERIKNIISKNFNPKDILAIAFTRSAAAEMKKRLAESLPEQVVNQMTICTFHSLAVKIIREYGSLLGYRSGFSIYDETDQLDVVKQVMKDLNLKKPKPEHVVRRLSENKFATIRDEYRDRLKGSNAFDFDGLMSTALYLLKTHQHVRDTYSYKFRFVSVDEFQDLNAQQYEMAMILAGHWGNICAVGDPDQNIMTFQGSNVRYILGFKNDCKDLTEITIDRCYRCPKNLLKAAHELITNNRQRLEKEAVSDIEDGAYLHYSAHDEFEEGAMIAKFLTSAMKDMASERPEGVKLSDVAILVRTHRQKGPILEALKQAGIPVNICGRTVQFYGQPAVKDFLAYLRILENPHDIFSFRKLANAPDRKVSWIDLMKLEAHCRATNLDCIDGAITYFRNKKQPDEMTAREFETIKRWREQLTPPEQVAMVSGTLKAYYKSMSLDTRCTQMDLALERYKIAAQETGDDSIAAHLELVSELTAQDDANDEDEVDAVQIMTIHTAKGLEFPVVIVPGMEDGIFPISAADNDLDEMEQERRLFYVAITRAQSAILTTRAKNRNGWKGMEPMDESGFLEELGMLHRNSM